MLSISQRIAEQLNVQLKQVESTIQLLDSGATVPFIARYRKEVTGGLDDTQLRLLSERLIYLRELDERRVTIVGAIDEQGKLTDKLKKAINAAQTKTALEDLYLPYKKKRRTKAQMAREAGLEPLAEAILQDPTIDIQAFAKQYLNVEAGVTDSSAALDGARQILIEKFAEDAQLIGGMREFLWSDCLLVSKVVKGKEQMGAKYGDYFDYQEIIHKIPSHRALALFRGRNEGVLSLQMQLENEGDLERHPCESRIAEHFDISHKDRNADQWLTDTVRLAWKVKISIHLELELKTRLKDDASDGAIKVFADNLRDLLLAAPAGAKTTLGLDPGLRSGVKVAVVDETGKLLDTATIFPHAPQRQWDDGIEILALLCKKHRVQLVSIGNGTASRETDRLVLALIHRYPEFKLQKIVVSEAGASVYSASEFAAKEFPKLDVTLRGAVSIARRLQDPLAELVKIDPKAIGVGQYQHDVSQTQLARKLNDVVEDCVNAVGIDVNMASAPLLAQVAGLTPVLAENIIKCRDENGSFNTLNSLKDVPRMGPKAFEQAGGFLRVVAGDDPLDNSAVHPEAYPLVTRIAEYLECDVRHLVGDKKRLRSIDPAKFSDATFGIPTITDILLELEKPGRDPRPEFRTAEFKEGVEEIKDLTTDMVLQGVVSNVTNFGAFVDIGVHQDGLVHISMLADKFVKDARDVVKAGDVVKVKVLEVDIVRKRIALTMRLEEQSRDYQAQHINKGKESARKSSRSTKPTVKKSSNRRSNSNTDSKKIVNSAMADALKKSLQRS
ncbi:MAG: Tex family protein [Thiohalomonadales bacterium]